MVISWADGSIISSDSVDEEKSRDAMAELHRAPEEIEAEQAQKIREEREWRRRANRLDETLSFPPPAVVAPARPFSADELDGLG
jgi:hypothetical protein